MKKFDVRICHCGRIHFVDEKFVVKALETQKPLLLICGHCGHLRAIGGDKTVDDDGSTAYNMYCCNPKANSENVLDTSRYSSILHSEGRRVMMETGYPANTYNSGVGFQDMQFPDGIFDIAFHGKCYQMRDGLKNMTVQEYLQKWAEESLTVNMDLTLSMMTEDEQKALSGYSLENIDFSGTKYASKWNTNKVSPCLTNYKKYAEEKV